MNHYETLGVKQNASSDQIKTAYRTLAKKLHPDLNPNNKDVEEKFKKITEAYNVLSDVPSKSKYDREKLLRPINSFEEYGDIFGNAYSQEFYSTFYKEKKNNTHPKEEKRDGKPIEWKISIPLKFVMTGKTLEIDIPVKNECTSCKGSGKTKDTKEIVCHVCGGRGEVRNTNGFIILNEVCYRCKGKKTITVDPCPKCNGSKTEKVMKKVRFDIPKGIETNMGLTMTNIGDIGDNGGSRGNINIRIEVKEDALFKREKYNLKCKTNISFYQAIVGDKIEIENLDEEKVSVYINPETQNNSSVKVPGKGLPIPGTNNRGDLFVEFQIDLPKNISKEEYDIFNELKNKTCLNKNNKLLNI